MKDAGASSDSIASRSARLRPVPLAGGGSRSPAPRDVPQCPEPIAALENPGRRGKLCAGRGSPLLLPEGSQPEFGLCLLPAKRGETTLLPEPRPLRPEGNRTPRVITHVTTAGGNAGNRHRWDDHLLSAPSSPITPGSRARVHGHRGAGPAPRAQVARSRCSRIGDRHQDSRSQSPESPVTIPECAVTWSGT